jgi:hypothetical protein
MLRMLIMFLGLMKDHGGLFFYLQIQVLGKPVYTTMQIDIIFTLAASMITNNNCTNLSSITL